MSGGYVAVTKSSQFNDVDNERLDNLQFYKPKGGLNKVFGACNGFRRKPRFTVIAAVFGVAFAVLLIVIIAVSVRRNEPKSKNRPSKTFEKYSSKDFGLQFLPEPNDQTILLNFRPMNHQSYSHYYNYLNGFLHDYNIIYQQNPEKYVDCKKGYAPADKVCKFASSLLGPCSTYHEYGYHEGNPCVLLILKLPPHMKAVPAVKGNTDLGDRWSSDTIGVSCKGATDEDEANIAKSYVHNIPAIQYFPEKGFPTYYYRNITAKGFLHPLVMVKFNTIADHHYVGVKCTAWIQHVNHTKTEDFTTSFIFNIH